MSTFFPPQTIGGWATIIAVAGGIYFIQKRNDKSKRPAASKQASKQVEPKKEKAKKGKKTSIQSDGDSELKSGADKKKKSNNNKKPAPAKTQPVQSEPPTYADVTDDKEEEASNREFARRMAAAKTGAITAPKSKAETRQKSVKQSRAQEKQIAEVSSDNNVTAPSSANGGDADDDESPINSPGLSATTLESPVSGGVADMLEKPSAGPSVLKITAPTDPAPAKKQKTQAAPPAESKKQRQNRQKAEAAKAIREAEEAERQKLMEQTRRNARLAEGRAAKDGSAFMASSKAPTTSSWTAPLPTTNGTTTSDKKVELLDTTEAAEKPVAPKPVAPESKWETSISEEDQIRMITENENWETVKKDKKKRAKKNGETSSADEDSKEFGVPPKIEPTKAGQKWTATLVHVEVDGNNNKKVVEREVELQDSEWEVS